MGKKGFIPTRNIHNLIRATGFVVLFIGILAATHVITHWSEPAWLTITPIATFFFVAYGILLMIFDITGDSYPRYVITISSSVLSGIISFALFIVKFITVAGNSPWEKYIIRLTAHDIQIENISPIVALSFLIISVSFIQFSSGYKISRWINAKIIFWMVFFVILLSLLLLIANVFDAHVLFGINIIPQALATIIALLILGTGVMSIAAVKAWPENEVNQIFSDEGFYVAISVFLAVSTGIITSGYLLFQKYEKQQKSIVEYQLKSVSDDKVEMISHWRNERLRDADLFYKNPNFSNRIKRFENNRQLHPYPYMGRKDIEFPPVRTNGNLRSGIEITYFISTGSTACRTDPNYRSVEIISGRQPVYK